MAVELKKTASGKILKSIQNSMSMFMWFHNCWCTMDALHKNHLGVATKEKDIEARKVVDHLHVIFDHVERTANEPWYLYTCTLLMYLPSRSLAVVCGRSGLDASLVETHMLVEACCWTSSLMIL